jgi:ribonuclease P protein component
MAFAPGWRPTAAARSWPRGVLAAASGLARDGGLPPFPVAAVERLRRRTDFRAAAAGIRASANAFVVQARRRTDEGAIRVGFTVSKQVGNAVERNRVRRRLREVVKLCDSGSLHEGHDYVLIGRRAALALPFDAMRRDFDGALRRIHATRRQEKQQQGAGGSGRKPPHETGSLGQARAETHDER